MCWPDPKSRLSLPGVLCRGLAGLICLTFLLAWSPATSATSRPAVLLDARGVIGPPLSDYLQRGIATGRELKAAVVIIRIDSPGGLDSAMRDIIQAILSSPVPVISYVAPDGARAASAGTYILYASHLAAMAPATNLGAATPVHLGTMPGQPGKPGNDRLPQEGKDPADPMERKIVNDASAYIRALADRHGRNAEWAVKAVREAVSLSAREALAERVIDIVATDVDDLLRQADGRLVRLDSGETRLDTRNLIVTHIGQSWRVKLLSIITDPNVAYLLMLLGVLGLIYELSSPGFYLPGVAGSISLLLALYAFQVLPVNYGGLALILLGILLLVAEAFLPTFGSLGVGGLVAFAVGSIILIKDEEFRVSPLLIAVTVLIFATLLFLALGRFLAFRRRKLVTGTEAMLGMTGEAAEDFSGEGRIWLLGESWRARCRDSVKKGEKVKVTAKEGLVLTVEKLPPVEGKAV